MKLSKIAISLFLVILTGSSLKAEARFHRVGYVGAYPVAGWPQGYWYHGSYAGRPGWWWIVGPGWYYYPAPIYPYPPPDAVPVYVVQVNAPPPPPAPPPPGTTAPTPPPSKSAPSTATAVAPGSAPASAKAFSYYCEKSKGYYPAITNCPDGWVATPVKPPGEFKKGL